MTFDHDLWRYRILTTFLAAGNLTVAVMDFFRHRWLCAAGELFWTGVALAMRHLATLNQRTRNEKREIRAMTLRWPEEQ